MGRLDDYQQQETYVYQHTENPNKWRVIPTAVNPETGERESRQKTLTGDLADAIRARETLKAEIRGEAKETENPSPTKSLLVDFAGAWAREMRDDGDWSERTYAENFQMLEDHIVPTIGHVPVDGLTRDHIRQWRETIREKTYRRNGEEVHYSQNSLRRFWAVLQHLVKALYLEGHCDRRFHDWVRDKSSPESKAGDDARRERDTLTVEELFAFLEKVKAMAEKGTDPKNDPQSISDRWYPHTYTLAWTGMRFGESAGLEWRDIDFETNTIKIRRSFSQGRLGPPKGGKRKIGMTGEVAEVLHHQRQLLVAEQNLGFVDDGIVFPSDDGGRRWSSSIHPPMQDAAAEADIDIKVGPQVLRSTLATLLDELDASVKQVQTQLGHKSLDMALHYDRKREKQMVRTLESAREKAADMCG